MGEERTLDVLAKHLLPHVRSLAWRYELGYKGGLWRTIRGKMLIDDGSHVLIFAATAEWYVAKIVRTANQSVERYLLLNERGLASSATEVLATFALEDVLRAACAYRARLNEAHELGLAQLAEMQEFIDDQLDTTPPLAG